MAQAVRSTEACRSYKMVPDPAGVSLDKVAVLAGHSNLNTTAKYVRPSVQDLEKAVDQLSWE